LIPLYSPDGSNGRYEFRPDNPRIIFDKKKNKEKIIKYERPAGSGIRVDCPPRCKDDLGNPQVELWVTEGIKKADAGASHGLCIIALTGVHGFKGKNEYGGITFLADWDYIHLKSRTVNIVFDSDVMRNPQVGKALELLTEHLQRKGALVNRVYLPIDGDEKVGLDDYFLKHSVDELAALIDGPRPTVKAAPALVELLEGVPDLIGRPLSLLKGRAHVAVWPYVKITVHETTNKDGEIVRHNPPIEKIEQRLMIVRGDGVIFGDGRRDIEEVGANIRLPEIPLPRKLWSTRGVKSWLKGARPDPAETFERIVAVINRFIDFDKSLAGQREMCELIACYILATWFLEGFNVIGYIWPNGERGSGKTQLLILLAELGYLGQFILASGSFAALRDLADYGALLCFDDAENLSDPKTTDPDKRTLLLASNRRGSSVPVKEQGPDGMWKTRHVNTYCAKAYSAIRLPDGVLASRTITVPLVRSGDRNRANADPLEYDLWPYDRQKLIDDMWALAITHLSSLPVYERRVNTESDLTGRNLEPWRAILAIAQWLDDNGVKRLSDRMQKLSVGYQSERSEFESGDLTRLVVSAISAIFAISAVLSETPQEKPLTTSQITEKAKQMADEDESGIDPETISTKRVGWILKRLRLEKAGREDGKKGRQWLVKTADISRWKSAYSLMEQKSQGEPKQNGENGENGETAETGTLNVRSEDDFWHKNSEVGEVQAEWVG
jgi:hypothetical protein